MRLRAIGVFHRAVLRVRSTFGRQDRGLARDPPWPPDAAAGLDVSWLIARLGLGLAALGRPGYLNLGHGPDLGPDRSVAALRARTHEVLDAAYAAGVRDFDVARSYGRAEEFLGDWLRHRNPAGVTISSKWGYVYTAGWEVDADPPEVRRHDVDTFRRQLSETRENLGEWLALYQIHSATPDSGVLENDAVLTAMQETDLPLGVSVSGTSQAATIDRALELGLFDAVQATWNLHERAAEAALERAHAAGLKVIVKEALANGRLADRDAEALAAALAQPWATVVLSGASSVSMLRANLRAREAEPAGKLEQLIEESESYWARRAKLDWN